jgi:hypothetical protein
MRHLIESLPPALWRAYAAARDERDRTGAWPSVARVRALAQQHGACPWALLALTRGELPELDRERRLTGELVRIDDPTAWTRPTVLAPTPDCLRALYLAAADLYCRVVDPWGRDVPLQDLDRAARDWADTVAGDPRTSLAPVRIAPPALPLEAEH